jgi:hypothetical protein
VHLLGAVQLTLVVTHFATPLLLTQTLVWQGLSGGGQRKESYSHFGAGFPFLSTEGVHLSFTVQGLLSLQLTGVLLQVPWPPTTAVGVQFATVQISLLEQRGWKEQVWVPFMTTQVPSIPQPSGSFGVQLKPLVWTHVPDTGSQIALWQVREFVLEQFFWV